MDEESPITKAMLLMHDVLRQVSHDNGRHGIAIINLCAALTIVIDQMKEGPDKDKATAHVDAVRTNMAGADNE